MRSRGFTLIELIIVIVLLGILGVISTDILSQSYRNYLIQKETAGLQSRSKQLLDQLRAYLDQAIKPSIARFDGGVSHTSVWDLHGVVSVASNDYLEWIGKDVESLKGMWNGSRIYPGYSGLADVRQSGGTTVVTSDCDLSFIDPIQGAVTDRPMINGAAWQRAALYFVYADSDGTVAERFWEDDPTSLFGITGFDPENQAILLVKKPEEIGERYCLSYSAYGIGLEADGTLSLYWDFRPWNNEKVTQGTKRVLMRNVQSLEYRSEAEGTMLRFKVCLEREEDPGVVFCKETVVLR